MVPLDDEFSRLGISFPLFRAPAALASGYVGSGVCGFDGTKSAHCFRFGSSSEIVVPCPTCNTLVPHMSDNNAGVPCPKCGAEVDYPSLCSDLVCYACLRKGRVAYVCDTEYGTDSFEEARHGCTGGFPGLTAADLGNNNFELGPVVDEEEGWRGVVVNSSLLMELLRTPRYSTWQGDKWMFHCGRVMTFVGAWKRSDFEGAAPGRGRPLFVDAIGREQAEAWDYIDSAASAYVHRCERCGTLRGHIDSDQP